MHQVFCSKPEARSSRHLPHYNRPAPPPRKRDAWLKPPSAAELKKRTLTYLYNENPNWLQNAHRQLDHAVLAAYGWPKEVSDKEISDQEILARLLQLSAERAASDGISSR